MNYAAPAGYGAPNGSNKADDGKTPASSSGSGSGSGSEAAVVDASTPTPTTPTPTPWKSIGESMTSSPSSTPVLLTPLDGSPVEKSSVARFVAREEEADVDHVEGGAGDVPPQSGTTSHPADTDTQEDKPSFGFGFGYLAWGRRQQPEDVTPHGNVYSLNDDNTTPVGSSALAAYTGVASPLGPSPAASSSPVPLPRAAAAVPAPEMGLSPPFSAGSPSEAMYSGVRSYAAMSPASSSRRVQNQQNQQLYWPWGTSSGSDSERGNELGKQIGNAVKPKHVRGPAEYAGSGGSADERGNVSVFFCWTGRFGIGC